MEEAIFFKEIVNIKLYNNKHYFLSQTPLADWAPSILFSTCSLVAAAATLLLPETSDKAMPNTIVELEELHRKPR